jgi:hypothetical protein
MLQSAISITSPLIAVAALAFTFFQWRKSQLRRDDVLRWSNEVIKSLETLLLITMLDEPLLDRNTARSKLLEQTFNTATLVEQGRLFFKNEIVDDHGLHKPPAYRGYRPAILDPIVVAHQIARALVDTDGEDKLRMRLLAEDSLKSFVSLAQKEIGRDRTATADTKRRGDGLHLHHLLNAVDETRLATLKKNSISGHRTKPDPVNF